MTIADDLREWLVLLDAPGLGSTGARRLADGFGGPAAALLAGTEQLARCGIGTETRSALKHPDARLMDRVHAWLDAPGRHAITLSSADYPPLLAALDDAPPVLFVLGDPGLLGRSHMAVVGSRNPTRPGVETARDFSAALCELGLGVVSGLATGIDAAAHRGALDAGGITLAVAAHGLDTVYPARHRELAHAIVRQGAIVSEFLPGTPPLREHFPRRNRVISGLCLGVLVVEAAVRSGSLITARLAAEQGREVFAIPGSIHNPMARGCHRLIRQGAKLVETVEDLVEELGWGAVAARDPCASALPTEDTGALDDDYVTLLNALGHDPASVDVLVQRTGLTPQALSSMLLTLEMRGIVHPVSGTGYVRAAKRE